MNGPNNGRPLTRRKMVQLLVIITILAWATQTLLTQWGFGAEMGATAAEAAMPSITAARPLAVFSADDAAKFVPAERAAAGAGSTLELRGEATVHAADVRLKQVCRWSERDAAAFLPIAELVVAKLDNAEPYRAISMDELKSTLRDAGTNLAFVRFSGPTQCMVNRTDVKGGAGGAEALDQWINAAERPGGESPATRPVTLAASVPSTPAADADAGVKPLRQLLTDDLAVRLGLPADQVQVAFNPKDDRVLNLCEPQFRFNIAATKARNLGDVAWDVTLVAEAGGSQKLSIAGIARAWQTQVVASRPLAGRQVIRAEDVTERRTLVDRMPEDAPLSLPQVVHQQAARDIRAGSVFTGRLVEAVPLARPGQFVTVTLDRGSFRVKTVGRAIEGGSYGQTIKVRNEATGDVYAVVLFAPQEGTMSGSAPAAAAAGAATKVAAAVR